MRPNLSDEQILAATTRVDRAFIEAGPGAGKTTVAAERFGVLRFRKTATDPRGVVALSFTHSAANELRKRIVDRWGPRALDGPSRARTIDAELVEMLCILLRTGHLRWPEGHTELNVIDSWDYHRKYKYKKDPRWACYAPGLNGRKIVPCKTSGERRGFNKGDLTTELKAGRCTHHDVRRLVRAILDDRDLREIVAHHRQETVAHLMIDEVFDADDLDLELIRLHHQAGIPVTVIGDRWQALYEFRNALPELVRKAIEELDFSLFSVLHSYRFKTDQTKQLGNALRGRLTPTIPDVGSDVHIVIAAEWKQLWYAPTWVLPISFGQIRHQTDALMALLLDYLLRKHFDVPARTRIDALLSLRIEHHETDTWPDVLAPIEKLLPDASADSATRALTALRNSAPLIGAQRRVGPLSEANEGPILRRMQLLAKRVNHNRPFVLGISAHQAKGQEWDRVGVCLTSADIADLADGLTLEIDRHRTLYVALTRGRKLTGAIAAS